jgi:hypothetical protein
VASHTNCPFNSRPCNLGCRKVCQKSLSAAGLDRRQPARSPALDDELDSTPASPALLLPVPARR